VTACGGSSTEPPGGNNPICRNQGVAQLPLAVTVPIRGSLTIKDRIDKTVDAAGKPGNTTLGMVVAYFGDYSTVTSTKSPLRDLSEGCVGVIGRPLNSSATPLPLASLAIKGTAKGDVLATRTSTGVFTLASADPLMQGIGSVHAVGSMESGMSFPAFDQAIDAVITMEVTEPPSDGKAELKDQDLTFSWVKGAGDWAEIDIVPVMTDTQMAKGGQVSCFVPDNGCFTVPKDATMFLLASQANRYTASVERHHYVGATLDARTHLDLETIAEFRLTLLNGVLAP
jgi:hypothetical protein